MKLFISEVVLLLTLSLVFSAKNYTNYSLFRTVPRSSIQVDFLVNLPQNYDINFWREPLRPNFVMEFSVSPDDTLKLYPLFAKNNIKLELLTPNIQRYFDEEIVSKYISRRTNTFTWMSYYQINDIYNWMKDLELRNKNKMSIFNMGRTYEGRDILGVNIKYPGAYNSSRIFIEAGIHSRERIAVAVATYIINEIVNAVDPHRKDIFTLARMCEWYIVPCLNPDGYEYTFTTDRMWRKNRKLFTNGHGVDLNRNFDVNFASTPDEIKASTNVRSGIYPGPSSFSEEETRAISQYAKKIKKIDYYIALHSYGQIGIIPYANSKEHYENYDEVFKLCTNMGKAIEKMYGTDYTCGTAHDTIGYMASGTSADWMKKTLGVRVAMSMELRDKGARGFSLPKEDIIPTSKETIQGISYLVKSTVTIDPHNTHYIRLSSYNPRIRHNCFPSVILLAIVFCSV